MDYDDMNSGWRQMSVGELRKKALKERKKLEDAGEEPKPVVASGRNLAKSFWGQAWCKNLERYQDYEYRIGRGRSYLRNGSVIHLQVDPGLVSAVVVGQEVYQVEVRLAALAEDRWQETVRRSASRIESVVDLLTGRIPESVMEALCDRETGLFPEPDEIRFSCTCLDWADMCKHVAAVLYGVGVRLDAEPELFFTLRGVDHHELIQSAAGEVATAAAQEAADLDPAEIEEIFGIELDLPSDL